MTPAASVTIKIGWPDPRALDGVLMAALDSVEVTQTDDCPGGFQLVFNAEPAPHSVSDYPLLASQVLSPGTRVFIIVTAGGLDTVLMDGLVTRFELTPSIAGIPGRIVITGEDVSVAMALYEYSIQYPFMPDFVIATAVLTKWIALGIVPTVLPTPTGMTTFDNVPQQASDDRTYLKALAAEHGYIFCIRPGPIVGMSTAYWGPPLRMLPPQPTLTVGFGSAGNVVSLSFNYDSRHPHFVWGLAFDMETEMLIPVPPLPPARMPPLGSMPAFLSQPPFIRTTLFDHGGMDVPTTLAKASSLTDQAFDQVVVGKGELDGLQYGAAMTAPGMVAVRGAGNSFDGLYYVQSVTHHLSRGAWSQNFVLNRDGMGSTFAALPI
jgi:hypothetical protein